MMINYDEVTVLPDRGEVEVKGVEVEIEPGILLLGHTPTPRKLHQAALTLKKKILCKSGNLLIWMPRAT